MKLTEEQKQRFSKKVENGKCPFCGGNEFAFTAEGDILKLATIPQEESLSFVTIPALTLVCSKCGHISFFNPTVAQDL